jgi:exosortase/archaeosortase family protein
MLIAFLAFGFWPLALGVPCQQPIANILLILTLNFYLYQKIQTLLTGHYYKQSIEFLSQKKLQPFVHVFLFALITYTLHSLWWHFFWKHEAFYFLHQWASVLAHWVYACSAFILDHVFILKHTAKDDTLFFYNGSISIIESCSGLKQFYQLFFLLLLFPGPLKHKLWFIPSGMFLIFLVNVFRIVSLSYILLWFPDHWDFAHLWILRPFYYVVIFVVWLIWVEKLTTKKANAKVKNANN